MRYLLIALALLIGWSAHACAPAGITCGKAPMGAIYQEPGGLWAREYGFLVRCNGDTLATRIVTIRWEGSEAGADAGLNANANQFKNDLKAHYQRCNVDWETKLANALREIDDDLYEAMGVFASAARALGTTATPEQLLGAWTAAHEDVTWIDSGAYLDRLAEKFGMTRAQLFAWVAAHGEWL